MIGIFDSGVGGLTVAREIKRALPEYDLIYFGDTARTPYGSKSKETIIKYALQDADFLIQKGARVLVVACNTVSSFAIPALHKKYPKIPIFEVITPAVEQALKATKNNRIGIIGTRATVNSQIYEKRLHDASCSSSNNGGRGDLIIKSRACPLFVPFIEEGAIKSRELKMIARRYLTSLKNENIDTLILGCTHYPIIKNIIQLKIGTRVMLIDSAESVSDKIKNFLKESKLEMPKTAKLEIYFSDLTEQTIKIAQKLIKQHPVYESSDIE